MRLRDNLSLLFIEDLLSIRDCYREFLSSYFHTIYETSCGLEALQLFKKYTPDVLLVDINIKSLNGIEVIKKIREVNPTTKIVILSAHKDENYLFDAIELNIIRYLVKPIKRYELKLAILKAITEASQETCIYIDTVFRWNLKEKQLFLNKTPIDLTKSEFTLFSTFCTFSNPHFSLEQAYFAIYNDESEFNENKVKMIIKRLRKKTSANLFKNIYGMGYKFNI